MDGGRGRPGLSFPIWQNGRGVVTSCDRKSLPLAVIGCDGGTGSPARLVRFRVSGRRGASGRRGPARGAGAGRDPRGAARVELHGPGDGARPPGAAGAAGGAAARALPGPAPLREPRASAARGRAGGLGAGCGAVRGPRLAAAAAPRGDGRAPAPGPRRLRDPAAALPAPAAAAGPEAGAGPRARGAAGPCRDRLHLGLQQREVISMPGAGTNRGSWHYLAKHWQKKGHQPQPLSPSMRNLAQAFPALLDLPEGSEVSKVSCGSRHTAAVTRTGELYTWGWGKYGQLGHSDTASSDQPRQVGYFPANGLSVEDVVCGPWNTYICAVEK
nr:RCC1 domain-containing protein 1 isoform X2 [Caretta caretta]